MTKYIYIFIFLISNIIVVKSQNLAVSLFITEQPCELAKAYVVVDSGLQPITFLWSNGSISDNTNQLSPGDYSVKITDAGNHDTTIYFAIQTIICEPIPENHFTPNGDNFNDTWDISRIEHFPNFELFVYNRWGQLIHHQSQEFIPWDGRSLTLPTPDATYYYILYLDKSNKKEILKGDVSIIR